MSLGYFDKLLTEHPVICAFTVYQPVCTIHTHADAVETLACYVETQYNVV